MAMRYGTGGDALLLSSLVRSPFFILYSKPGCAKSLTIEEYCFVFCETPSFLLSTLWLEA